MQPGKENKTKSRMHQFQDKIYNKNKLNNFGIKLCNEFGVSRMHKHKID